MRTSPTRCRAVSNAIFIIVGAVMLLAVVLVGAMMVGKNSDGGEKITAPQQNAPLNAVTSQPAPSAQPNTITSKGGSN